MTRFEDRHRELRMNPFDDEENINPDLWDFEHRTGPLVDDLVVAVREREAFDAPVTVRGKKAAEFLRLDLAVTTALAALDEASGG